LSSVATRLLYKHHQCAILAEEKHPGRDTSGTLLYPHLSGHRLEEHLVFRCGSGLEQTVLSGLVRLTTQPGWCLCISHEHTNCFLPGILNHAPIFNHSLRPI